MDKEKNKLDAGLRSFDHCENVPVTGNGPMSTVLSLSFVGFTGAFHANSQCLTRGLP